MGSADPAAVRVIHRHRIGGHVFARVSELTYQGALTADPRFTDPDQPSA